MWAEQPLQPEGVVVGDVAPQGLPQLRVLPPQGPLRERREAVRVALSGDEGVEHRPPGSAQDVGGHVAELTLAVSSTFWTRLASRARASINCRRSRVSSRSSRTGGGGTKLPRSSPCSSNCESHWQSLTSVLRPGTALTGWALTSRSARPQLSRMWYTGHQETPVLSMATCVHPAAVSQSANLSSPRVVVPKVGAAPRAGTPETGGDGLLGARRDQRLRHRAHPWAASWPSGPGGVPSCVSLLCVLLALREGDSPRSSATPRS